LTANDKKLTRHARRRLTERHRGRISWWRGFTRTRGGSPGSHTANAATQIAGTWHVL